MKASELVKTFADLKRGWHYGIEGEVFDAETIGRATDFLELLESKGLEAGVFPGFSGEIRVAVYDLKREFDFHPNGTDTFQIE